MPPLSTSKRSAYTTSDSFEENPNEVPASSGRRRLSATMTMQEQNETIEELMTKQTMEKEMKKGLSAMALLSDAQQVATNEKYRNRAFMVLMLVVFADAMNLQVLAPNYILMVTPDAHPDSFPSTAPFGVASANYVVPMCSQLGIAFANLFVPAFSDKVGRRPLLLVNLFGSVAATLLKYFLRGAFWSYNAANFVNGIFSTTVAVGLAYISDLYADDQKKADERIGYAAGIHLLGRTAGAFLAVGLPDFLFKPLIPAAGITLVSAIIAYFLLPESSGVVEQYKMVATSEELVDETNLGKEIAKGDDVDVEKEDDHQVDALHRPTFWNIIIGAIFDNIGSIGLVPFAVSPLMFETFTGDFLEADEEPVLSEQGFRWVFAFLAISVLPAAAALPYLFGKYGPALCCVVCNVLTGALIIVLQAIASAEPTARTLIAFIVNLYIGVPITTLSQLSTAPMLDRITTPDKRGYVQGINQSFTDATNALAPFCYGLITDNISIELALWIATGLSFLASFINSPLVFNPRLAVKRQAGDDDDDDMMPADFLGMTRRVDEDTILGKIEKGDRVRMYEYMKVNLQRMDRGDPFLVLQVGDYAMDAARPVCHKEVLQDYTDIRDLAARRLALLNQHPELKPAFADRMNVAKTDEESARKAGEDLGRWFASYLTANGWRPEESSPLIKHMIATSFPRLSDPVVTAENVETRILRMVSVFNQYVDTEEGQAPFQRATDCPIGAMGQHAQCSNMNSKVC